jgi:nucleoid-associated protein YejK
MNLRHVIVHKIDREQNAPATYQERDNELNINNPLVTTLIEGILNAYSRGKSYGSFNSDVDNYPVQGWLSSYLGSQRNSQDFVAFTKRLLRRIGNKMTETVFATGGYFIFSEYATDTKDYFLVAMVKDRSGLMVTSSLEISNVTEIDLNNLHQATQVNLDSFANGNEGYLSFLKTVNQTREVLAYFTEAMGCTDVIPSKTSTDQTFKVVEAVCHRAGLSHQDIREIRSGVYEYLKNNVHNSVTLNMIAAQMNRFLGEQYHSLFVELANSEDYRISTEFQPNPTALRNFRKIDIKSGRWSLNFEKELLGNEGSNRDIVWNGETLIFRNIPEKYIQELNSILDDNQ